MKILHRIAIAILLLSPLGAAAQSILESVMKDVEKSKSLTNEVYSERRNPDTKTLEKASYAFEFTDNKLADKLIDAIRRERDHASSYELVNRHNQSRNVVYTITFDTPKAYAQYTLIQRGESKWMLTVTKSGPRKVVITRSNKRSKNHTDTKTTIYRDGDENVIITVDGKSYDIADMSSLCQNAVDEALREITWTTSDGEMIYIRNFDGFDDLSELEHLSQLDGLKELKQFKQIKQQKTSKKATAKKSARTIYKSASKSSSRQNRQSSSSSSSFSSYSI
ncbi:MAG: DUF5024 domain-containing protein [Duncaniella sp.]|nr:DUF5024 domain-containing protein [Duncaniella sp.]